MCSMLLYFYQETVYTYIQSDFVYLFFYSILFTTRAFPAVGFFLFSSNHLHFHQQPELIATSAIKMQQFEINAT